MPSQKFGVEMPHSATALAALSHQVPRPTAATMPVGMPISSAITNAIVPSWIVTGSFCSTSSSTGCCVRTDSPKSPFSTPPTQYA
jgi:hypothetical protein